MNTKAIEVRTFAVALYLLARDIRPLGVERDSSGEIVFFFPASAAAEVARYRADKTYLNDMAAAIR